MNENSKKLVKNTAILSIGTICTKGILFIMIPLLTRWLTQEQYGIFDLIVTYISLLVPLISLNCGEALFRFLMDKHGTSEEKSIITNAILINIIGFIISLAIIIIVFIFANGIRDIIFYIFILLIAESINNLMLMIMRGFKKLTSYTIANIIFVLGMVISSIILVKVLSLGLPGIILSYALGYFASFSYMVLVSKVNKYFSLKDFDKKIAKEMLAFSIPLIPNAVSWWIMDASDRTIVSIFLGSSTNAVLAVAHKIPNLCQNLYSVFHVSWQENAVETINNEDRNKYYNFVMNNMVVILVSISALILTTNFIFFNYIFSSDYASGYYQVPILVLAIIFSMLAQFLGGIFIAEKRSKVNGLTTTIAAVINLVVNLSLIKFIGIYAATISTLISYICLFVVRYCNLSKDIKLKFNLKSMSAFIYIMILFGLSYLNNLIVNAICLIASTVYFIYVNKNIVKKVLKKIFKR